MFVIQWRGKEYTNKLERSAHIPSMIVNHSTIEMARRPDYWFRTPNNKQSYIRFLVNGQGEIELFYSCKSESYGGAL